MIGLRRSALALLVATTPGCFLLHGPPIEVVHEESVKSTGVAWKDTFGGIGKEALVTDQVTIHYTAKLQDGPQVDSSHDRGLPETIFLSAPPVLGWMDGIPGMKEGGRRWLLVPPHRAFGEEGIEGLIPPGATLEFLIELLEVHGQ